MQPSLSLDDVKKFQEVWCPCRYPFLGADGECEGGQPELTQAHSAVLGLQASKEAGLVHVQNGEVTGVLAKQRMGRLLGIRN